MSSATSILIKQFERLSPEEKTEFTSEFLRRVSMPVYGDITDDELISAARQVAMMLDGDEDAQAR